MKILFMNSIGPAKWGGGEKWMITAARGLQDAGHEILVAGRHDSEFLKRATRAGLSTYEVDIRCDLSPVSTWRIKRRLETDGTDLLVCNFNRDVRVAGLAARLTGRPAVVARHGVLLCGKKWRHRLSLRHLVDGILTNTESIRSAYEAYGWFEAGFVRVIYNGIEAPPDVPPHDFGRDFPGKKIVFGAGRLAEQKGFAYLIEAAAILGRRRDDIAFVVAGKGKLERDLIDLAAKRHVLGAFHLIGFVEATGPYLSGCDLFVLPSLHEGMPNAVMEAMAAGKAVVATDVNGVRELVEDGSSGLIVPPRRGDLLAEAIEKLIDKPEVLKAYGQRGKDRVNEHFTIPKMIGNLETYFGEVVEARRRKVGRTPAPPSFQSNGEAT